MWALSFFDLPVGTREQRKAYRHWRRRLLQEGFRKLQYSVYGRHFRTEHESRACRLRLRGHIPAAGEVRFLTVTERQMERMEILVGRRREPPEEPTPQLILL